MTAPTPAGWYPDPAPSSPSEAPQLRWWDGAEWTSHLRPVEAAPVGSTAQPSSNTAYIAGSEYGGRAGFGAAPQPPAQTQPPAQAQPAAQSQPRSVPQATGAFHNEAGAGGRQSVGQQPVGQSDHQQPGHDRVPAAPYQQAGRHPRSPYTEPVMAVSQRRKIIELTNEYDIYGSDGQTIGQVVEVGQSGLKKAARFLTSLDQYMTHKLEVRDAAGQVVFTLTRPPKIMKSTLLVTHPNGAEMGRLVQQNVFGKIRFSLEAGGRQVGMLSAENWIAWNFRMTDQNGAEVGRITKTFEGIFTTMFTTADNYSVQLDPNLQEPLKSLCIAAALCVDTALKQDSRGFG